MYSRSLDQSEFEIIVNDDTTLKKSVLSYDVMNEYGLEDLLRYYDHLVKIYSLEMMSNLFHRLGLDPTIFSFRLKYIASMDRNSKNKALQLALDEIDNLDIKLLTELIKNGANPHIQGENSGWCISHAAAKLNDFNLIDNEKNGVSVLKPRLDHQIAES